MSRAYSVKQVRASARVEGADALSLSLCLLDILDPSEMGALLREELAAAGWSPDERGVLSTVLPGGARVSLSDDGSEVTARIAHAREVTAQGADREAADTALREASERARARASAQAARALDALEPELRALVGEAVQRVYVRALKTRAARLGTIESVDERVGQDGQTELTIRVRV